MDGGEEENGLPVGSSATISNSTVADNSCTGEDSAGNGLYVESLSEVTIINSILWGNGGDDFVYVDEESFEQYKPVSFRELVDCFREYKDESTKKTQKCSR